jgi:hypothetical protein
MTHPPIVPDPRPVVYAGRPPGPRPPYPEPEIGVDPGLVPVQAWRPGSEFEATARSAMSGGMARKP